MKQTSLSKVVKAQNGQLLLKYGQAYFPLRSIQRSQVSQKTRCLLTSYPCWIMKQSLIGKKEFRDIARNMIQADPKQVYVLEQKQQVSHIHPHTRVLACMESIKFSQMRVLHIMLTNEWNMQQLAWIDAPLLQQIYISVQGAFHSIKPLQKTSFEKLSILNLRGYGDNKTPQTRMFSIMDFHRIKLVSYLEEIEGKKVYTPPGTMNICRQDLSNINFLAKLQIQRLTNFHVPHLQLPINQHHRFTPNADYPWCPQLQFSQSRIYKALNNKFSNKTVALSISDVLLGNVYGEQMQIENRMQRENNNQNPQNEMMQEEEDYDDDEIDSDLDRNVMEVENE